MYIFSNGLPQRSLMTDAITIVKAKNNSKTVIEMKEKIIDFIILYSTPWLIGLALEILCLLKLGNIFNVLVCRRSEWLDSAHGATGERTSSDRPKNRWVRRTGYTLADHGDLIGYSLWRYPIFEHHHSTSLHEPPISFYDYIVDPDLRLLQNLLISKEVHSKLHNAEQPKFSQSVRASSLFCCAWSRWKHFFTFKTVLSRDWRH